MKRKMAYVLMTRKCNLTCPYCDVKDQEDNFDHDKFFDQLRKFDGTLTLFGGEPTLFRDRLREVLYSDKDIRKKVTGMTTNLMVVDDELMGIFREIGIATSWNPSRFRNGEYEKWVSNLDKISGEIRTRILVTMTHELLDMNPKDVIELMSSWNKNAVKDILFENLIDCQSVDPSYFRKADEWLCEIYKNWNNDFELANKQIIYGCKMVCNHKYHITPEGNLISGCPHDITTAGVPVECFSCEYANVCRPCRLQKYCSFPKKFYNLLQDDPQ